MHNLTLTLDDVREAALALMDRDGYTTADDVLRRLQAAGFRAYPAEVATLLDLVATLETWSVTVQDATVQYGPAPDASGDADVEFGAPAPPTHEATPGIWIRLFLN